jgi:hypothetical protein
MSKRYGDRRAPAVASLSKNVIMRSDPHYVPTVVAALLGERDAAQRLNLRRSGAKILTQQVNSSVSLPMQRQHMFATKLVALKVLSREPKKNSL